MEEYTIVKYLFETSTGKGHVTMAVSSAEKIEEAGERVLAAFGQCYQEIKLLGFEIVQKQ